MNESELRTYVAERLANAPKSSFRIPLAVPPYTTDDVMECLDSILRLRLTMGAKVNAFEQAWAGFLGTRHCIMTNSGSTANLLALSTLTNPALKHPKRSGRKMEVITSPVTFPTSVNPIVQVGDVPVYVDVELETMDIDSSKIEHAISKKTRAIMPVHFMGFPCNMERIMEIAESHGIYVVEDACEAPGATVESKRVGTFGDMGTFSFFFSHHISTVEGGAVVASDDALEEIMRGLRSYGWIRTLRNRDALAKKHVGIDSRHLYTNIGYNFKPTELNAALGLGQISRLDRLIALRREIAIRLTRKLAKFSEHLILPPYEKDGRRHVYFGYPVLIKPAAPFGKLELMSYLENHGIETRQLEAGNVLEQPSSALYDFRVQGKTKNAETIMRKGFFFGIHQGITADDQSYIVRTFENFFEQKAWAQPSRSNGRMPRGETQSARRFHRD